jgi:hypothetical protein
MDVNGKTIIVLVNDPAGGRQDVRRQGDDLTTAARTYKYEKARPSSRGGCVDRA